MRVGVLALQGDFEAHSNALARRGAQPVALRRGADINGLAGLVMPGGESTSILKAMDGTPLAERLRSLLAVGMPVLATCAGVILLAREVRNPPQASFGLLDVVVERNAYGRQLNSTVARVDVVARDELAARSLEGVFIRAPRVLETGPGVEIMGRWQTDPVLLRQGRLIAATFHPELSEPSPVIDLFLAQCGGGS